MIFYNYIQINLIQCCYKLQKYYMNVREFTNVDQEICRRSIEIDCIFASILINDLDYIVRCLYALHPRTHVYASRVGGQPCVLNRSATACAMHYGVRLFFFSRHSLKDPGMVNARHASRSVILVGSNRPVTIVNRASPRIVTFLLRGKQQRQIAPD